MAADALASVGLAVGIGLGISVALGAAVLFLAQPSGNAERAPAAPQARVAADAPAGQR